ncbi:MAG: hypothetical protein EPN43_14720 [Jatrophihabitans sp.]|nr:MAG: hypothetical protein EPN43_14720 [Jatrophihabitans sp.]
MSDVSDAVARSADAAGLSAPVPTLLLELQSLLGALSTAVTTQTDRGRRPFRPGPEWPARLGELAFGLYLLADQTGVDVDAAVTVTAAGLQRRPGPARGEGGWPFETA